MSDRKPLMPKATAVWLVENTSLSFEQIAEFCGLHVLEVKGIADGDVAQGIKGLDPVTSSQLDARRDRGKPSAILAPSQDRRAEGCDAGGGCFAPRARYTPVSRRHDRPNAVLWLLKNHPELKNSQIMRLVGTTKPTIAQIKDRTHWNSPNLVPQDPVTLGLCTQTDLDAEVKRAAQRIDRERREAQREAIKSGTLLPTEETTAPQPEAKATADGRAGASKARRKSARKLQPRKSARVRQAQGAQERHAKRRTRPTTISRRFSPRIGASA